MRFRVSGHEISLDQGGAYHRLRDVGPERIYIHYVVINERRYPVKQAFEVVTGLDRQDFTTNDARRVFRRLGLTCGRQ